MLKIQMDARTDGFSALHSRLHKCICKWLVSKYKHLGLTSKESISYLRMQFICTDTVNDR